MGLRKLAYALCKLLNYCKYVAFVFVIGPFGIWERYSECPLIRNEDKSEFR